MKKFKMLSLAKKILVIICFTLFLSVFIIMLIGSFKPSLTFSLIPVDLSPFRNLTFDNYAQLQDKVNIPRAFGNSIYVLALVVVAEVFLGVTTGYAFAVKNFPLKKILFGLVIVTMMLPRQLLLIPNFMVAKNLGLMNSLTGVGLTTINASYGIFLTRQHVLTIPKDYYEAAKLDGCNEFQIYFRIILPLLKPVIAGVAIYSMFGVWNDYLWQNVMLTDTSKQTIPILLAYLANSNTGGIPATGLQLAGSVVALVPVMTFFIVFQRWFIEGVGEGGVKE